MFTASSVLSGNCALKMNRFIKQHKYVEKEVLKLVLELINALDLNSLPPF